MSDNSDFKINYLSPENYSYSPYKRTGLPKVKILGAILYLMLLAAVPALLYIWGTKTPSLTKAVSSTSTSIYEERGLADPTSGVIKYLKTTATGRYQRGTAGKENTTFQ